MSLTWWSATKPRPPSRAYDAHACVCAQTGSDAADFVEGISALAAAQQRGGWPKLMAAKRPCKAEANQTLRSEASHIITRHVCSNADNAAIATV